MSGEARYVLWLCSLPGLGNATLYRLFAESGEDPDFARKLYAAAGREDSGSIPGNAAGRQNGPLGVQEMGTEDFRNDEGRRQKEGQEIAETEEMKRAPSARKERKVADILRRGRRECSPEQLERNLQEKRIHFVWAGDAEFPKRLRKIPDPPFALYYRGRLPEEERRSVGIVGARMASSYGREQARNFAVELAAGGIQIISGMAHGVDGIAGRGALEVSDASFAVLGCGVDICYPRENRDLYETLCERGGVISEYRPGTEPEARLFPPRNRIISALSDALLVVEARERSGTLITVDCALEQGKDVFAVPGRVCDARSTGCNALIRQGAGIAVSPKALLEELTGEEVTESRRRRFRPVRQAVRAKEEGKRSEENAADQAGSRSMQREYRQALWQEMPENPAAVSRKEQTAEVRNPEQREEPLPVLSELERSILCSLDASTARSVDEIMPEVNRRMHPGCTFPVILRAVMKLSAAGYVREIRVGKYISCVPS